MMNANLKLSILIPTKNRQRFILDLVAQIDGIVPANIEYIIHDNSDTELTLAIKQKLNIKYIYTPKCLSVGENFSEALYLANGEYVCFIGDDDVVIHDEIIIAINTPASPPDVIVSPIIDLIFHAGCKIRFSPLFTQKTLIKPNILGELFLKLIYLLSRLTKRLWVFWLLSPDLWCVPKGYFGVFRKSCFIYTRDHTAIYLSPDTYLMGALSEAKMVFYHTKPCFIPGTSKSSTSNLSNNSLHIGRISEQKHLNVVDLTKIPKNTPDVFYPEIIWAASYLAGKGTLEISYFHAHILKGFIYLKYRGYYEIVKSNSDNFSYLKKYFGFFVGGVFYIINRILIAILIVSRYKLSNSLVL